MIARRRAGQEKSGVRLGLRLGLGLSLIHLYPSPSPSLNPLSLVSAAAAQAQDTALLDAGPDRMVNRIVVPSPERKVGEVRLILRGEANVVQTLLYTKVLSRVVGEIGKKETTNWPPGSAGHADAVRYLEALEQVQKTIWGRLPKDKRVEDRRQRMVIEFVLTARAALVMIGAFDMTESGGEIKVVRREPIVTLTPSREYVKRNMRLIAADSFAVDEAALGRLLGPLELLQERGAAHSDLPAADGQRK